MVREERSCITYGPSYGELVQGEDTYSWFVEPEKQDEIRKEIDEITTFLKSEYGMMNKNVSISVYTGKTSDIPRPNYINGARYRLHDATHKIIGEIFILFKTKMEERDCLHEQRNATKVTHPYYVFITEIDNIPYCSMDMYKTFTNQIIDLSKALGLKMNFEFVENRKSPYWQPIFYKKQQKVDVIYFKQFLDDITYIADAFPLKLPTYYT